MRYRVCETQSKGDIQFCAPRLFILLPMTKPRAQISIKCCGRVQNVFVTNVLIPFRDSMGFTAPIYPPKCVSEWSNVIMVSHGPNGIVFPGILITLFRQT